MADWLMTIVLSLSQWHLSKPAGLEGSLMAQHEASFKRHGLESGIDYRTHPFNTP